MVDQNSQPDNFNLPQPVQAQQPSAPQPSALVPALASAPAEMAQPPAQQGRADGVDAELMNRVNQVIREYADDPHRLSQEIAAIKAEFIRSRYGKELKQGNKEA
jgi:hypothetical protein